MKHIFLFILAAFFSLALKAQNQNLKPTDEMVLLVCVVTDYNKVPEEGASIRIESDDKAIVEKGVSDIDGKYYVLVPEGKKYKFTVSKFGHDFEFDGYTELPSVPGAYEMTQTLAIRLVTNYVRTYTLDNVYFDTNKWDIKHESVPALNKLYHAMHVNPKMKVEIAGHTDDVGDESSNFRLSQHRADAIMDYLTGRGIAQNRIIAKGYGETQPAVPNTSDANRAKNRRTEVKVIEE